MTPLLLALLAAEPDLTQAEARCDLETLHRERAQLRDELGRAMWEPERAAEILWELWQLDRAIGWCGSRAT